MGEPWFGAKRYGIGLGPRGPAGWIAIAVYVVLVAIANGLIHTLRAPAGIDQAATAALTVGFLALMVWKSDGKPLRWRWGRRN